MQLAGCERGFSVQNQTLSPLEIVFNAITQNHVMKIIINGEDYVNFDFSNALQIFKTITDRKYFQNKHIQPIISVCFLYD